MASSPTSADRVTPSAASRWLRLLFGMAMAVIGLYVFFRPFTSLSLLLTLIASGLALTGVMRLVDDGGSMARAVGVLWLAMALAILVWPDVTVRLLVWVVGGWLIVDGMADLVSALRQEADEKLATMLKAAASVVLGLVAFSWPDITLLVLALVFAAKLVVTGVSQVVGAVRLETAEQRRPGPIRRWANVIGAGLAFLLAIGLAGISSQLRNGAPVVDDFYSAPDLVPNEPGVLIRSETFTRSIPDGGKAWRLLYTTTRDDGVPALASAVLVVPRAASGPLPVIAWAHGTTGVHRTCAPSVLATGFEAGAFFSADRVVEEGWALVATDYIGLGTEGPHPYLIGQGEARSVLDSVRAAHQLDVVKLEERTVVWGHSQGGHAALWTGAMAPSYAPDTNVIGVAALAPASDPLGLVETLPSITGGNIFAAYAVWAYSQAYDDVDLGDYVTRGAQVTLGQVAARCLAEPAVFASLLSSLAVSWSIFTGELTDSVLGDRFAENIAPFEVEAPLLLAQGGADSLITTAMQDRFVEAICAAGEQVDYRLYDGRNHVPLVESDSPLIPELLEWTRARLTGEPPTPTCQ